MYRYVGTRNLVYPYAAIGGLPLVAEPGMPPVELDQAPDHHWVEVEEPKPRVKTRKATAPAEADEE